MSVKGLQGSELAWLLSQMTPEKIMLALVLFSDSLDDG